MTPIKSKIYTPAVRAELEGLWDSMRITAPGRFERPLSLARNGRSYYEQVVGRIAPRMPWWVLACIHGLESNFDFTRHLHNGDSLRWRTRNVPAGRPLAGKPPFTWEESAADAVRMKGFDKVEDWSVPRALWLLEKYNGLGYRLYHGMASPYLWAGTNHYSRGKYVGDGKFSAVAVSKQAGAAGILQQLGIGN